MVVILVFYAKIWFILGEKGYFMNKNEPITPQEQAELEIVLTLLRNGNMPIYQDIAKIAKDLSNSIFRNRQSQVNPEI